jgi:hypothetical protein
VQIYSQKVVTLNIVNRASVTRAVAIRPNVLEQKSQLLKTEKVDGRLPILMEQSILDINAGKQLF